MSAEIFPTPLDWVALAVLLVSLLAGFMRGFLIEAIALCGWVGGFFLARAFAADVAAWLPMENSLPGVRLAAGFALIYVLAVFAGGFVAWMVSRGAEAVGLRAVDRGLGAVFGVCRALLIVVLMVWLCGATPLARKPWWPHSWSLRVASGFVPLLPKEPPSLPPADAWAALLHDPSLLGGGAPASVPAHPAAAAPAAPQAASAPPPDVAPPPAQAAPVAPAAPIAPAEPAGHGARPHRAHGTEHGAHGRRHATPAPVSVPAPAVAPAPVPAPTPAVAPPPVQAQPAAAEPQPAERRSITLRQGVHY